MVIDFPLDPAPESGLLRDLMSVSSGTIAGLAHRSNITGTPDQIQERLILFYLMYYQPRWERWSNVWTDFKAVEAIKRLSPTQRDTLKAWLAQQPEENND